MKLYLLIFTLFFVAGPANAGEPTDIAAWLDANLHSRSWSNEIHMMQDFAKSNDEQCKSWSPMAFTVQKDLYESCQFGSLLNSYLKKMKRLKDENKSGIVMPEVVFTNAALPVLQSGAWQSLFMSEVDGIDSALEIILIRIAIEKSLAAHARFIRQQSFGLFSPFASFVVPRMLANFSGYSQTLQRLVFLEGFECPTQKTQACVESVQKLSKLRAQILRGIGSENFLSGMANMNAENSSRDLLKAQTAQKMVVLLTELKAASSVEELQNLISGKTTSPRLAKIKSELSNLSSSGLGASSSQQANMLVAVSILTEISELQNRKAGFTADFADSIQSRQTAEEFSKLKSLVLTVLNSNEVVQ